MLCGFPPFYDESIRSLTAKVVKGQYTFLSPWWDPISKSAKDLVSHLLCVDPNERYTIDEFFAHPWMQQFQGKKDTKLHRMKDPRTQAMQNAAMAAAQHEDPSTTTPPGSPSHPFDASHVDQTAADEEEAKDEFRPLRTPDGSTTKRQDLFTPGFASLKEILDITYAVQRMGEESPQPQDSDTTSWTEDDDDDDEDEQDEQDPPITISSSSTTSNNSSVPPTDGLPEELVAKAEQLALSGKGFAHAPSTVPSSSSKQHHVSTPTSHRRKHQFKLNMDQATLLKNRRGPTPSLAI
jgi:serine/threonine protein kinase